MIFISCTKKGTSNTVEIVTSHIQHISWESRPGTPNEGFTIIDLTSGEINVNERPEAIKEKINTSENGSA